MTIIFSNTPDATNLTYNVIDNMDQEVFGMELNSIQNLTCSSLSLLSTYRELRKFAFAQEKKQDSLVLCHH